MTGTVAAVNPVRGMVAVETDQGYSIFEMLGDDPPPIGDRVRWDGATPLGREVVENLTQRRSYDVFFENHHVSKGNVRGQLRLQR